MQFCPDKHGWLLNFGQQPLSVLHKKEKVETFHALHTVNSLSSQMLKVVEQERVQECF